MDVEGITSGLICGVIQSLSGSDWERR